MPCSTMLSDMMTWSGSKVVADAFIIIIIIIIVFGPYWSIGRLQQLSSHPDPGPAGSWVSRQVQLSPPSFILSPPGMFVCWLVA